MDIDNGAYSREAASIAPLKFWIDYEDVQGKPGEPREVEWCQYVKKGGNGATTNEKIARLKKSPELWPPLEKAYDAWKKGQEEPADGTPLAVWPGVNSAQADRLRGLHIRTVEDVAGMNDADMDRLGMGARSLRDKAKAFVLAKQGQAQIAEAMADKDKQISALTEQVAELSASVKALAEAQGMTEQRGPGRPRKAAA